MKKSTIKIMVAFDIILALTGIVCSILVIAGLANWPVRILALVGLISLIMDGSAFIAYSVRKARLEKQYQEYAD